MNKAYIAVEDLINYLHEENKRLIHVQSHVTTEEELFKNRFKREEVIDLVRLIPKELESKFVYAETEE